MSIQVTTIEKKRIVGDTLGEVLAEIEQANNLKKLSIVALPNGKYSASFEIEPEPEPEPEPTPDPEEPEPEPEPQEPENPKEPENPEDLENPEPSNG